MSTQLFHITSEGRRN